MNLPAHVLAEHVFSELDTATVSACRGVCTEWRVVGAGVLRRRGWRSMQCWARTHGWVCSFCLRNRAPRRTFHLRECEECYSMRNPSSAGADRLVTGAEAHSELIWPFDADTIRWRKKRRLGDGGEARIWRVDDVYRSRRYEVQTWLPVTWTDDAEAGYE